jgi:hypothetical protein
MIAETCESFARDFFRFFEATWQELEPGRAEVTLPVDLAGHFGAERLRLSFLGEASEEEELVAPGSRVFDRMVSYLSGRGRFAAFVLVAPSSEALRLPEGFTDRVYLIFDFLLTFSTDERVDYLFSVALNESGALAPEALGWLAQCPAGLEDDALPAPHPLQWLSEAERWARAEAVQRAAALEQAARTRLSHVAAQLEAYFRELIREVPVRPRRGQIFEEALAEALREQDRLEGELSRRLADEARRHQLRVTVKLVGYATLRVCVNA